MFHSLFTYVFIPVKVLTLKVLVIDDINIYQQKISLDIFLLIFYLHIKCQYFCSLKKEIKMLSDAVWDGTFQLTLKAPRKTVSENVVCLCRLLNILANFSNLFLHTGNSVDPDQTAPKGAV